jgi:hypothetical protein
LVRGGPEVEYDALAFLQKYFPGSDAKYAEISAYGEKYMRTHGEIDQAHRDIILLAKRMQQEFEKQLLSEYTRALRGAESSGDAQERERLMQKIISLTQSST